MSIFFPKWASTKLKKSSKIEIPSNVTFFDDFPVILNYQKKIALIPIFWIATHGPRNLASKLQSVP